MPNWCEGVLRLRGTGKNLSRFFDEVIKPCSGKFENSPEHFIKKDIFELDTVAYSIGSDAWFEGTNRAFVVHDEYIEYQNTDEIQTVGLMAKQAWNIRTEDWTDLSKKYSLDIRFTGFERGCEFSREVIAINGELTVSNTEFYDDYIWECQMPFLGG